MDRVTGHDWPGNIRGLKNRNERWVILSKGPDLNISENELRSGPPYQKKGTDLSMAAMERRHILKVLKLAGEKINGKEGAAELLQLHPPLPYQKTRAGNPAQPGGGLTRHRPIYL